MTSQYGLGDRQLCRSLQDPGAGPVESRQVDIVAGSNTEGLIAVRIVRRAALQKYSGLRAAFDRLGGRISAEQMRQMNYAVDGEKKDASKVVSEFLRQNGL